MSLVSMQRSRRCGEVRMSLVDMQLFCVCDHCGEQSSSLNLFKRHIQVHCGEKGDHATTGVVSSVSELSLNSKSTNNSMHSSVGLSNSTITPIVEETASQLALVGSSSGKPVEGEACEDEEHNDMVLTFLAVVAQHPVLWNPFLWSTDFACNVAKKAAIQHVVDVMSSKYGQNEWRADQVEEELIILIILWFRIKRGLVEEPWFVKHLQFLEAIQGTLPFNLDDSAYQREMSPEAKDKEETERLSSREQRKAEKFGDEKTSKIGAVSCPEPFSINNFSVARKQTMLSFGEPAGDPENSQTPESFLVPSELKLWKQITAAHIDCFVELLHKNEALWNPRHPQFMNEFEAMLACNRMACEMSRTFESTYFKPNLMLKVARHLTRLYVDMFTGKRPKLWFFEKMSFLTQAKEAKDASQMESAPCSSASTTEPPPPKKKRTSRTPLRRCRKPRSNQLHNGAMRALIGLYKQHPSLWRKNHVGYHNIEVRMLIYKEIATTLNADLKLKLTATDVQKKIHKLLTSYRQGTVHPALRKLLRFLPRPRPIFTCQYCDLQFGSRKPWIRHQYSHVHAKPLRAKGNESSRRRKGLACMQVKRLPAIGAVAKPFACSECELRFVTKAQLEVHRRCHNGEKPHFCLQCGLSFPTLQQKLQHREEHAPKNRVRVFKPKKKLRCLKCAKNFATKSSMTVHMHVHNNRLYKLNCGRKSQKFRK